MGESAGPSDGPVGILEKLVRKNRYTETLLRRFPVAGRSHKMMHGRGRHRTHTGRAFPKAGLPRYARVQSVQRPVQILLIESKPIFMGV